jgi:hypothetical protein
MIVPGCEVEIESVKTWEMGGATPGDRAFRDHRSCSVARIGANRAARDEIIHCRLALQVGFRNSLPYDQKAHPGLKLS